MRVVEIDLSFTFLIYFIAIQMSSFHEFMAICSVVVCLLPYLLTIAHCLPEGTEGQKNGKRFFKVVLKIANVACTVLAFF